MIEELVYMRIMLKTLEEIQESLNMILRIVKNGISQIL